MIVFLRGPIRTGSITTVTRNSEFLLSDIIELGNITNTKMNLEKCIGPGRKMEILGWSSILSKEVLVIPPKKIKNTANAYGRSGKGVLVLQNS